MKKMIGVIAGLLILIGIALPGQAKADNISAINEVFNSGFYEQTIYSDPGLTTPTGKTLNPKINQWRIFNMNTVDNKILSYDLGGGQWVSPIEFTSDVHGSIFSVLEVFSSSNNIKLFSDPITMSHSTGYLNNDIHEWKVNRIGYVVNSISRVDLGSNQWAYVGSNTGLTLIRNTYYFDGGTQLTDEYGNPTQTISALGSYRVFGAKMINGNICIRLGNNQQWAKMSNGTFDF